MTQMQSGIGLHPALEDFRDAARIARAGSLVGRDASMVIRPAVQGRFLARVIGDQAAEREFDDLLTQESNSAERQELVRQEESMSAFAPILGGDDRSERRFDALHDPEFVEQAVDQIMKASGLPDDRRPFVIADARKCVVIERVQQDFCRHLQPHAECSRQSCARFVRRIMTNFSWDCLLMSSWGQ